MILEPSDVAGIQLLTADVVIVGAGPAGIVLALELADRGKDVLIIESGRSSYSEDAQNLSEAETWDHESHAPVTMTVRRQVGGTSVIWGGRCVPYDPVDFDTRAPAGGAAWPIGFSDVSPYHQRACDWLKIGRAVFDAEETGVLPKAIVPGLVNGDVKTSALERWSLPTNFGAVYMSRLKKSTKVRVLTGFTAMELVAGGDGAGRRTDSINARSLEGQSITLKGGSFVVAAGGLESTRLLLTSRGADGGAIGDHSGHLGRWYMSHIEGVVSEIVLAGSPRQTIFDYERDSDGVWVRRRFTFSDDFIKDHDLPNIAAWIANPGLADSVHQSGPLSFVYLMLESPLGRRLAPDAQRLSLTGHHVPGSPYGPTVRSSVREHLRNIAAEPVETARFVAGFGAGRFLPRKRKVPGFFIFRPSNRYPFQYHAEHWPNPASRVSLSRRTDDLGMPKLDIKLAFSESDVDGVVRSHACFDDYLRKHGVGYLEYLTPEIRDVIRSRAGGGFHQIGTTRMSRRPEDGVVDANLAVHGYPNTFVLSSSSFTTSSQANSTFLIVAMAVRLAERLSSGSAPLAIDASCATVD